MKRYSRRMGPALAGRRYSCGKSLKKCDAYFIGQVASATAACGGEMVTNLPDILQQHRIASLFLAHFVNLMRFHGMMSLARDIGGDQRLADLVASVIWAVDGLRHHDQAHNCAT